MKKLTVSLVLVSVLFTLCSCGRTYDAESQIPATESGIADATDNLGTDSQFETEPTVETETEPAIELEVEPTTETELVICAAESTFNTMINLTKEDCTVNALGQYEYKGLALTSDDCEWIDSPQNKEGTVEAGAVYRKLALCLEAFSIGNKWSSYAPFILGYTPETRDEFAQYVNDLSTFIVADQSANSIRAKFQTMNSVSVTEEDNTYTIIISDLAETAKELNICDEMIGHILCAFHDGGATVTFNGNSCTVVYKDYWAD